MTTETIAAPAASQPARDYSRCYYLGDYEDNGYHDSYFHVVFWDDVKGEREHVQWGATAYGGRWNFSADLKREIPADVAARITANTYRLKLASFTAAELARVLTPAPKQMPFGSRVRITKDSRKGCKTPYKAGEVGEVSGQYWFGTFYGNGYNHKTRANGRNGVRMADGRTVYVAMNLCRLDEEPNLAGVERDARAAKITCPHAWWTSCNPAFCA